MLKYSAILYSLRPVLFKKVVHPCLKIKKDGIQNWFSLGGEIKGRFYAPLVIFDLITYYYNSETMGRFIPIR
ncbi:hypothetical protein SAMN02927921_00755 [Sinomicrobium oceani]|uniref:Uncharacterized protein n=1 Tax=Sinomicrobium oceani TaxID=1150368 RepID=A0A1K1MR85_9FLAO|nr:hypothetical protein SAMN02927921_00755 [Sinomicrobium oceani]